MALARLAMGTVLLTIFFFLRARQMMISISSCVENKHLCEIQKVQTCKKMGFEENVVFSVEVGMHSDRARDYQTLHSDYFLRLNSI